MSPRGSAHEPVRRNPQLPTEFVRSHYRATWTGAVLRRESRTYKGRRIGDLLTVVLLLDRRGNPMRRRIVKEIDETWTTSTSFDPSGVNPDWWILP